MFALSSDGYGVARRQRGHVVQVDGGPEGGEAPAGRGEPGQLLKADGAVEADDTAAEDDLQNVLLVLPRSRISH